MRFARDDHGQELVEFALLALPLFMLLFGIMEFGVAVWRYNTVAIAAREGARAALVLPEADRVGEAEAAARAYAQGLGLNVGVTAQAGTYSVVDEENSLTVPTIQVVVTYDHPWITGLLSGLLGPVHMQASSTMLVE